jgi:hypothetical protein
MNVPMSLSSGKSIELNNITESGTGYIRFSDGTQICYGICNALNESGIKSDRVAGKFTYPKSFISTPVCSVIRQYDNYSENIDSLNKNLTIDRIVSSSSICLFDIVCTTGEIVFPDITSAKYIAIGRWK